MALTGAETQRRYRERHGDRVRQRDRERLRAVRAAIFDLLGGVCARCGFADHRAIQIDHVHHDGSTHRLYSPGWKLYRQMRSELEAGTDAGRYQLLCANCHFIKTYHEP